MLISKIRRDAGLYHQADGRSAAGGGSEADGRSNGSSTGSLADGEGNDGGAMSPEKTQAELETMRKALKTANKESEALRKKFAEIEAAEATRKESELSEAQKAAKRAEDAEKAFQTLQATTRQAAIRGAVLLAAAKAEFEDPEDAVALADLSGVTVGDDMTVTGAEDAVKKLASAKKHLLKQAQAPGGGDINARDRGRAQAPSLETLAAIKRTSGDYVPF